MRYFTFFHTTSLKSSVQFVLTAHLSLDPEFSLETLKLKKKVRLPKLLRHRSFPVTELSYQFLILNEKLTSSVTPATSGGPESHMRLADVLIPKPVTRRLGGCQSLRKAKQTRPLRVAGPLGRQARPSI